MSSGVVNVRVASASDYDLLVPLFLGLREFSRAGHPPRNDDIELVLAASREYLRDVLSRGPTCRTFLATGDDARPAGYIVATIHPPNPLTSSGVVPTGSIDELFVDAGQRGSGAGHVLVATACSWLAEQGAVEIDVGAYAWNTDGIAFYEREGFAPWLITLRKSV